MTHLLPADMRPNGNVDQCGTLHEELASLVLFFSDRTRDQDRDAAWRRARESAFATPRTEAHHG